MMDIDRFKNLNDTYGHGFGDEVLIAVSKTISGVLRESDILARYGGEEFAIVIYGAENATVLQISERICASVRRLRFRYDVKVSISVGLIKAMPGETQEEIYHRADKQLYRAKNEGRDRICYEY